MDTTPALEALAATDLDYTVVRTERASSVEQSAQWQGIAVGSLIKTLVVRRAADDHLFVLVPGDRSMSWPKLRAHLQVSRISLPNADEAREVTGYVRGTITPFGARRALPVHADERIVGAGTVAIGGGGPGVAVHIDGRALVEHLRAEVADLTELAA